jgi:hypothetical protein
MEAQQSDVVLRVLLTRILKDIKHLVHLSPLQRRGVAHFPPPPVTPDPRA